MLKKYNIGCVLVCFLMMACNSSQKKTDIVSHVEGITDISFSKLYHEFGEVKEGETVGCYFVFENTGNKPLLISKVTPGCGCTAVDYPKYPVLPHTKAEIEVRFNTQGFHGHQYKVIKVDANIKEKSKELVVTANVIN
jgi:hypothetical protein